MTFFQRRKIAREAVEKALQAEAIENTKRIITSGDLTVGMVEKFLKACPFDTEVRIYPAGGGQIVITRRDRVNTPTDYVPWDNPEASKFGPKRQ